MKNLLRKKKTHTHTKKQTKINKIKKKISLWGRWRQKKVIDFLSPVVGFRFFEHFGKMAAVMRKGPQL